MNNSIKDALDKNLSGLRAGQADLNNIMDRIHGGIQVKKKVSLGLVLALALLMLSLAALAAVLLNGRDVVDQVIEPMAMNSSGTNRFTKQEVEQILAEAEKHGITLDEETLRRIRADDGYFKEELAMAFSREAFGGNFYTWDVADQLWFEEFWMRIGELVYTNHTVPQEGELSQEEIEAAAAAYIKEQTGQDYPLNDPSLYRLERQFTGVKNNPYHTTRSWYLSYTPLNLELPEFALSLTPQGEVKDYSDSLLKMEGADALSRAFYIKYRHGLIWDDRYGAQDWPQEAWQSLHLALNDAFKEEDLKDDPSQSLVYILKQSYAPFAADTMQRDEAIETAAEAVSQKFKLDKQSLLIPTQDHSGYGQFIYALGLNGDSDPVWKISFSQDYLAEIDAKTGQLLTVDQYSPGNSYIRRYVLDSLLPGDERAFASKAPVGPTLSPEEWAQMDQKPLITRDDSFGNDTYWEAILALNYTGATADRIWSETYRDYGEDVRFWPLVMQAFNDLYEGRAGDGEGYAGLPLEGDMSAEEALAQATKDIQESDTRALSPQKLNELKPAFSFLYDSAGPGSRVWRIALMDVSAQEAVAVISLDITVAPGAAGQQEDSPSDLPPDSAALGPDGRPLNWRSDRLPGYYWDFMEAHYPSLWQARDYLSSMESDPYLWPLEAKAVHELWFLSDYWDEQEKLAVNGLPGPEDIPQEKALEIAWEVFQREAAPIHGQEAVNATWPSFGFHFDEGFDSGRVWRIDFMDASRQGVGLGSVTLDAKTGEVLLSDTDISNG